MNFQNLCFACFAERRPASACDHCGWREKGSPEVDGQLAPGTILQSRYVVGLPLGRGGFSITYRGWDTRLHRQRAIKEYFPAGVVTREGSQSRVSIVSGQSGLYTDGIEKYLAEARVLARFEGHPCIVFPTDFFEENATAYLVMEYLEGETLRQYVTRNGGQIPYEHAVYYLKHVLDALAKVHDAGMLHRDVSPDNVFLTVKNETKLLDFGAARQRMSGPSAAMTVIIRDHYAPPEQYTETGKQGTWTDIYAFAATFYYALTGESPPSALSRLMNDEIRLPSELGVKIPLDAETLLMRALSIQPSARPHRIEEVRQILLAPPRPVELAVAGPAPREEPAPIETSFVETPVLPVEAPVVASTGAIDVAEDEGATYEPRRVETAPVAPDAEAQPGLPVHAPEAESPWRWALFAVAAVAVALGTYFTLERIAPRGSPLGSPTPVQIVSPSPSAPPAPAPVMPATPPVASPSPVAQAPATPPPGGVVPPSASPAPAPAASPLAAGTPTPNAPPASGRRPGLAPEVGSAAAPSPPSVATAPAAPQAKPLLPSTIRPTPAPTAPDRRPDEQATVYQEGQRIVGAKERASRRRGYELIAYAAERGFPEAEEGLGSLYVSGIDGILKPDDASALKWYRKAADHERSSARYDLARRLELGSWERQVQYVEPCKWWVPFCKADLPHAQVKLNLDPEADLVAWLRSQSPGQGSPAELKEALRLYRKLADQDRADAQERIGYMLMAGHGAEQNRFDAFVWFLRAARNGNVSAQYVVGKMYAKGEGYAVNNDAATCWLRKAAAAGVGPARRALVAMGKAKPTGDLPPAPDECRYKPIEE